MYNIHLLLPWIVRSSPIGLSLGHPRFQARRLGAVCASAFGAGFGGSCYALVPRPMAQAFRSVWRTAYVKDGWFLDGFLVVKSLVTPGKNRVFDGYGTKIYKGWFGREFIDGGSLS